MPETTISLAGRVCLVTGATSGIGAVTARELARMGASVVIVGRRRERCEATAAAVRQDTGREVEYLLADLSSQAEVRRLAEEFKARHPILHVLVNNAGGMFVGRETSVDGLEMTFALNHLAYFLLTGLLIDRLRSAPTARVVNVASDAHRWTRSFDFEALRGGGRYGWSRAYGQSKLANILFTRELARRLGGTAITANALHPGFVASNFFAGKGPTGVAIAVGARLFAISPEQGATTSVYLASSPEVEGVTGGYFVKCRRADPSAAARDPDAARRLWELSEELTGVAYP